MVFWMPVGLGVVVLVTGVGMVLHSLRADTSSPLRRRGETSGDSLTLRAFLREAPEPIDNTRSIRGYGTGAIIAGAFLIIATAAMNAAH